MLFPYLILSLKEQLTLVCDWGLWAHCSSASRGVLTAQIPAFSHHTPSWLFQASPDSHSTNMLQHALPFTLTFCLTPQTLTCVCDQLSCRALNRETLVLCRSQLSARASLGCPTESKEHPQPSRTSASPLQMLFESTLEEVGIGKNLAKPV